MKQEFSGEQWTDSEGHPAGGVSYGTGFCISWQNGPLGRGEDRKRPNGAFVETLLAVVASRIEFYNSVGFRCVENEEALKHIYSALETLNSRTVRREAAQVEGTHEGN